MLSACSQPIGDFGRINTLNASEITRVQSQIGSKDKNIVYLNPIQYSELEKKFRLTAHLLTTSNYNIAITDFEFFDRKANIVGPIRNTAILNSFKAKGLLNVTDRLQSVSLDITKRSETLAIFHRLITQIMAQDDERNYIHNSLENLEYTQAIAARHAENIKLIKKVYSHLHGRFHAYNYVIDQSQIVEPYTNMRGLNSKLQDLNAQISRLKNIY